MISSLVKPSTHTTTLRCLSVTKNLTRQLSNFRNNTTVTNEIVSKFNKPLLQQQSFFSTSQASFTTPPPPPSSSSQNGSSEQATTSSTKSGKPLQKMTREEYRILRDYYHAQKDKEKRKSALYYSISLTMVFFALAYASVPVYRLVCQKTGWGGTPQTDLAKITKDKLVPVDTDKRIRISFTAETSRLLPWKFVPEQREVYVVPGESALAFYRAKNNSDKDITGMATYSVTPDHVAPYFNKIQCFCFEEQRLNAGEEIDMPLFFFIDPEFANDPAMRNIDDVVLHYTFFRATHDAQYEQIMASQPDAQRSSPGAGSGFIEIQKGEDGSVKEIVHDDPKDESR
ncbi:unnamed protein product [Ambrosiozyma monospora]|uniref:Unnamed protein product n=1 Tax=Ambrosiozyma monospora TaxID=43982 RepID=A0ACB5TYW1_AMBMO|nr:unnamed protein product [Ambrosiozyma monospora]